MQKTDLSEEQYLTRAAVAKRWKVSTETIKRRDRAGLLHPLRFNTRLVRYALSEILQLERDAANREFQPSPGHQTKAQPGS